MQTEVSVANHDWDEQSYRKQFKEYMSDSFTNYNYVGNTKVSVSIKKLMPTNAHEARYF